MVIFTVIFRLFFADTAFGRMAGFVVWFAVLLNGPCTACVNHQGIFKAFQIAFLRRIDLLLITGNARIGPGVVLAHQRHVIFALFFTGCADNC